MIPNKKALVIGKVTRHLHIQYTIYRTVKLYTQTALLGCLERAHELIVQ